MGCIKEMTEYPLSRYPMFIPETSQVFMNTANAVAENEKGNGKLKVMGLQQMVWKARA